jgi:hypothetical protein
VERDFRAGKVENLAAYTLAALKTDCRRKTAPREQQQAARKATKRQERDAAERAEAEREREAQTAHRALSEALAALSPAQRQALEAEFIAALEAGRLPGAAVLKEQYEKSGFESIIVQSMFRGFARERLLSAAAARAA